MSTEELLKAMQSDNGALRDLAAQQLLWRSSDPAKPLKEPVVQSLAASLQQVLTEAPDPAVRCQALGTLAGMQRLSEAALASGLADADPRVRRYAVTLTEPQMVSPDQNLDGYLTTLTQEQDVGVLLQWSLSLGAAQHPSAVKALELIASRASSDMWLAKSLALVSDPHVDAVLGGLLKSLSNEKPELPPNARAACEQSISSLWVRASAATQARLLAGAFKRSPSDDGAMSAVQMVMLTAAAATDATAITKEPLLNEQIMQAVATARTRLFADETSESQRVKLVPLITLLRSSSSEALNDIARLLGPQQPPSVQQAALNAARRLKADDTASALLEHWSELLPEVRSSVCGLLLERRGWGEQFVVALENGKVKANDLDAAIVERLRTYGDGNLQARTARVLGQPPNADRAKVVQEMLTKMPMRGDTGRGEKQFVDHCAVCHRGTPDKPIVGAPLENIANWTREQWVVAILDPSRTIEPKYHQYVVATKDGRVLSGLIEDRSTHHLTLVAPDGKRHEIELSEIERLKDQGVSLMPDGLETKLDAAAMSDLVAYLETLKTRK